MKPALLPLTALRFFAAAAVVLFHRPHAGPDDWLPYERFGAAGVPFFFLLSGFILAYTYHDRFVSAPRPRATRDFLKARAARILPAYVLAFLIALWAVPEGKNILTLRFAESLWPAVTHLTLTQSLVPNSKYYFGFNAPAWSLSCEWMFYLAFPLLLLGLATGSARRRVAVFALASAAWATALGLYLTRSVEPVSEMFTWVWVGVFPLVRVFDFACGVALGVLFVRLKPEVGPAKGARYWAWGVVELGALGTLWAALHYCPVSPGARAPLTFPVVMLTWQGYLLPFYAALVWVGARGRGPLSRAVSWSPLVYLGELSYGVYIFHAPIFALVLANYPRPASGAAPLAALLLSAAAVLAVSALSYHFWETPIRRWVRGRPAEPAGATAIPLPERRAA